jgi:general secretion pathway protein C
MPKIQPQLLAPYVRYLPPAANLLLVVLIAASLAHIFWLVFPGQGGDAALQAFTPATSNSVQAPRLDIEQIAAAHLFGQYSLSPAGAGGTIDAPETSLSLTLKGIFASANPKASRALIADSSGKQKPYAIGDDVPGGATLNRIQDDRVILERNGRFETLRLERDKGAGGSIAESTDTSQNNQAATGQATTLAALRTEVMNDPGQASQYVRLQPVYTDGKLQGYRIYPGPNRNLFQKVGLRAGELVTSVNGVQLDDAAKAMQLLGDLKDAQELTLTLERAGQTRTVNLSLNQ